ncbi:hypothetical protein BKA66DRAFT_443879 [Pyrenochaeta sp. MPI-SDFR-AT-0127]|nr:hypothetical protein BKA66DRAFT_443879 [Pyrenochaeta sp. MPI-SDFR-AT-0127]
MQLQYLATSLAVFVAASAQNTTDTTFNFNCSSLTSPFSSSGQDVLEFNYTAPSSVTYRVSEAVICPSNATVNDTTCLIEAAGRISVHATTNITEINDVSVLKSLLRRALESSGAVRSELDIDMYLEDRVFDGLPRTHYVKPGEAAYFAFTPSMRCFNGTISTIPTCTELDETVRRTADTFNGKGLNVCIPVLRKAIKRTSKVEGSLGVVVISEEEARREGMSTNPADPNRGNSSDDEDDGVTRDPPGTVVGASARLDAGIFGTVAVALLALHMGNMA